MIIVPVKEGENIEKALKKFKRKFEKTGVVKELEDGARRLRTAASHERGIKNIPKKFGSFKNFP